MNENKATKVVVTHVKDGNGKHTVAAQLRVLISQSKDDAGVFVAQGLEIDYCSTGASIEDVQNKFATGFIRTISSLIKRRRPLSALFKSQTPPSIWQEYIDSSSSDELTCATIIDLSDDMPEEVTVPFSTIAFCNSRDMASA